MKGIFDKEKWALGTFFLIGNLSKGNIKRIELLLKCGFLKKICFKNNYLKIMPLNN